jgi:Raf kinase inhibitor-like YbhB/YbcL family protein
MAYHYPLGWGNTCRVVAPLIACVFTVVMSLGCHLEEPPPKEGEMALSVSSSVFGEGDMIPDRYTCQGEDISPPLAWSGLPAGTQSLALIMDDPDAPVGVFNHWVIFNIPADSPGLSQAVPAQAQLPDGARQGRNDFGRIGYGGPCPPSGSPHRYQFTLYALDSLLELEMGADKGQVLDAVEGHVLAQGRLTGRYQR